MAKTARRRQPPAAHQIVRAALAHGRARAEQLLARRPSAPVAKAAAGTNGLLIAEGDSWFDYPFYDVLTKLKDKYHYAVESVAHQGDSVEQMAYDPNQFAKLARKFEEIGRDNRVPRAILLSGGGNDIAGAEFPVLLNHHSSGLTSINQRVVEGVIDERLLFAVVSVISSVTRLSKQFFKKVIPIVIHGYDYPVPDGRGYLGGFWVLPGPWLKPGFVQKGYLDLLDCCKIMEALIDRFNAMLQSIPKHSGLEHVTCIDLRKVLSNQLHGRTYRRSWENELHPTKSGFEAVARAFDATLAEFERP